MSNWFLDTYDEIRKYSNRTIIFRPHPRCRLEHIERGLVNVIRQDPQYINGTYDDFNLGFENIWAVNWSSNPWHTQYYCWGSALYCPSSSVANDLANIRNIEDPIRPDRQQWLNDYAHTEWTIEEIPKESSP